MNAHRAAFRENGFIVLSGFGEVVRPVVSRLDALFGAVLPGAPSIRDFAKAAEFFNRTYREHRARVLSVYSLLDRTPELVRLSTEPILLEGLRDVGLIDPVLSSYPTWRLDLAANPPERTFPWHQEKYHDLFSDAGVSVWIPLHDVSPVCLSDTLWVKPGTSACGLLQTGRDKFDIVDSRLAAHQSAGLTMAFGDIVIFSNLLAHRSGVLRDRNGMRISVQLRYDDVEDADYRRRGWPANFKIVDAIAGYSSRADIQAHSR